MSLYSKKEINEIKKCIEKYKVFYLKSNKKPIYYLILTLAWIYVAITLINKSSYYIPLLSLLTMRLFIIFHDMCHNSYFKVTKEEHESGKRGYNKIVAELLEPFVLYDEYTWRNIHGHHHKVHGNILLDDPTRTVISKNEYNNLSSFKKILYRIFRNPLIFFSGAPIYIFWIQHLVKPFYVIKVLFIYYVIYKIGDMSLLKKIILAQYIAVIMGTMLFHLQHQVNVGYWKKFNENDTLSYNRAQLHGASMLNIPEIFKWATFGIEYHHIHHLTPRIAGYNLKECHEENIDKFNKITKIGGLKAFKSLFHVLYDEEKEKYISFPLARHFGLED